MRKGILFTIFFYVLLGIAAVAEEGLVVKEGLLIRVPRQLQRSALAVDPVEMAIAAGTWRTPKAGEAVAFSPAESGKWDKIAADANGWFSTGGDGYLNATVKSERDKVMILNGLGDTYTYVNGELRMGGKYAVKETYESWEPRFDYGQVPVLLTKGDNHLLFRCSRCRMKAVLSPPPSPLMLNDKDLTLPDIIIGERVEAWGAVVVINATKQIQRDLILSASGEELEPTTTRVGTIQPMSVRKAAFLLKRRAPQDPSKIPVKLTLQGGEKSSSTSFHEISIPLEAKSPLQNHKRTFRSGIDGSIQYYSVSPAQNRDPAFKPALVLSVQGASVEAVNQAASYASKTWAHIVAPTNRRPYGFDWEDWGRIDALEAMTDFRGRYPVDPSRVYLTGHSKE